ncbi:unnamed protein product [Lathyrus oleraceus]
MREVIMVSTAATLGNLLFGWDSSTIAGGMRYIKQEFHLETDPSLEGLLVSMSFLTGTIVTIFSGTVSDMFGRRPMIITSSLMFYFSGLVMFWARNVPAILLSRMLSGIAIALAVTITPLYISEIAPPDIRGLLNTLPQLSCSMGMFLAYLLVFAISLTDTPTWRGMLSIVSVYSVAYFFLAVIYLPESPPWLVSKGRISEAKIVLQRIRGVEDVSGELALLAEGLNPGGESIIVEEYIVAPASELISNKEAGKDCIKLYGPNQGAVSMVAQQITGQGSMLTPEGSISNLKDNIVNIFENMHENISKMSSMSHMGDHDSENMHAALLPPQGSAGEIPRNTDIGGGWQLAYKSIEAANGEGGLQRVYLHADSSAVSRQVSASTSGHDLHADQGGETFQAAALVSDSILRNKDMNIKPEVTPKRTRWKDLLDPGVKKALIVGIGLQVLQQISGISGFVYYAPQILDQAGVGALLSDLEISAVSCSIFVNVITTFCMLPCIGLSMSLMDITGRRSILLHTIPILILSLMILIVKDLFHLSSTLNAALTSICAIVYESIFCMGYGVIPNIICSEIFPTSVRGLCISICSLTFWISTLIITSLFPFLLQFLGISGVFGLFVAGCIASWIFIYLKVPETKGMPLEVIVEVFAIGSKPETN